MKGEKTAKKFGMDMGSEWFPAEAERKLVELAEISRLVKQMEGDLVRLVS